MSVWVSASKVSRIVRAHRLHVWRGTGWSGVGDRLQLPAVSLEVQIDPVGAANSSSFLSWTKIRQGYPLNLRILISGGKETNKNSTSNCEWSGISSNLKYPLLATANCSFEKLFISGPTAPKLLGTARHRGWQPRLWRGRPLSMCFEGVGLIGNAAQNWWLSPSKAKYWHETDSEQVPWGKDKKDIGKRVTKYVCPLKGERMVVDCSGLHAAHRDCCRSLRTCGRTLNFDFSLNLWKTAMRQWNYHYSHFFS